MNTNCYSMKKTLGTSIGLSVIFASLTFAPVAFAEDELSFNTALVSQYLWRGFDLNNENVAFQGGLDYEHENGFYAGAWASQYDFGEGDDGAEVDLYLGYAFSLNDAFWLDASVTSYQYTGESDSSLEWKVGLGHELFDLNYHYDQDLDTDYLELNGHYPLNEQWTAEAHYGINDDGDDQYYDYSVTLTYGVSEQWNVNFGYSDHEFDEAGAEGTLFAGIFVYF